MEEYNQNKASRPDSVGPAVGIIIVLIVIVLGGWYFFKLQNEQSEATPNSYNIEMQSESDELNAIEADLEATEIDNLDAELNTI